MVDGEKKAKYFLIPLMVKVKGEYHSRCHLLPCCFKNASGIKPYDWIQKLQELKQRQGIFD
jgi:hypothetical protein